MRRLHEQKDAIGNNLYDRVVIVGHSLGSIIAYDILSLYWNEISPKLQVDPLAIDEAEQAVANFNSTKINLEQFRSAQFKFWLSQYKNSDSWRVSDILTVGSPLAFAHFHIARNVDEFSLKKRQREFPTCPPVMERPTAAALKKLKNANKKDWFSFPATDDPAVPRNLHHAAVFAMTRWTNMYFGNDFVGGEIACLGSGVENKKLRSARYGWFPFISHTHYWDKKEKESLRYLVEKLQLIFHFDDQEIEA
ncbi:hypothetical protein GCM10007423_29120 [Dyadobacter endophyticus]|uniref:Uncharacterized protein n=1 Tax=Dyadobacter endophyticus TaxID=1749036 RepID=A0ABQ1YUM5_9BACT|nr:hypothetical protein GCM10007423_29120 [Dyadobacter endophyticus]